MLLAGFEPEDESPIVFLRLRKAARKHGLRVYSIAALADPGLARMSGDAAARRSRRRGAGTGPAGGHPGTRRQHGTGRHQAGKR